MKARILVPLAATAASLLTACSCDQQRSASFSGRLGDSVTAAGFLPTVPGGLDFSMSEWLPKSTTSSGSHTITVKVNYSTFADSVAFLRLTNKDDPLRAPIASFSKAKGKNDGQLFRFDYEPVTAEVLDALWNVFTAGNGMLEIQPHQGSVVRALLKPVTVSPLHNDCT